MKKQLSYLLLAGLTGCLSLTFAACSDDDNENDAAIQVDKELLEHGIEVDANMQTAEVTVNKDGIWGALIDEGENTWVDFEESHLIYKGSQKLKLTFQSNPEGADRTAKLQLFGIDDNDPVIINIRQHGKGDNAGNPSSAVTFQSQGLGHGVVVNYFLDTDAVKQNQKSQPESFSIMKAKGNNSIYNMEKIQELVNTNKLNKVAYEETSNSVYELTAALVDSTVAQSKRFTATVNMSASFGFIEFEAGVTYQAHKSQSSGHVDYSILRYAPLYEVNVSPAEIATYAMDESFEAMIGYEDEYEAITEQVEAKYGSWEALKKKSKITYNGWMKKLNKYRPDFGGVFSTGFSADIWEYYKAIMEENYDKAEAALENIDESYSPFVITGGTWGGSMNVLCRIDTMSMVGKDSLWAKLSLDVSGIGSVGGEVKLSSEGMDLFRNADLRISIYGGDPAIGDGITSWLLSPSVTNYSVMQGLLKEWIETMKSPADPDSDDKSAAAPIEYAFTPVWMLIDPEYRQFARDWFYEHYSGSTVLDFFGYCDNPRDKWPKQPSELLGSKE